MNPRRAYQPRQLSTRHSRQAISQLCLPLPGALERAFFKVFSEGCSKGLAKSLFTPKFELGSRNPRKTDPFRWVSETTDPQASTSFAPRFGALHATQGPGLFCAVRSPSVFSLVAKP